MIPNSFTESISGWTRKKEESPCHNCVVGAVCTRSFVDGSACKDFEVFIKHLMIKAGVQFENKD
jgi:hypothetical protein